MKKYIIVLAAILGVTSCKKSQLDKIDPNSPTAVSLNTQAGVQSFALGLYQKWLATVYSEGTANVMFLAMENQSIMGDEEWTSVGNFGFRYVDQVYAITLPNGTKLVNPIGNTQGQKLKSLNTLVAGETNGFQYEWSIGYYLIGQSNVLLQSLNSPALAVSATEKSVLQAWAYWWKGVAYSRIGSMYVSGIINDKADGTTNNNYVAHDAIIAEANKNFNLALGILNGITENSDYDNTMTNIIPDFNQTTSTITPAMWSREIYTYEARNYLVNKKVADMAAADWTAVGALAAKGLTAGDQTFEFGMNPTGTNDLSGYFFHPYMFHDHEENPGWGWVSERLIQDFKKGDARFTKGFAKLDTSDISVNRSNRGMQFGTRWEPVAIENGGLYASANNLGQITFAGSWEENALMQAEVDIHTANIEAGLGIIDAVRAAQGANLPAVAGTGLTLAQATEELRRERRIGLYLRGLAFYDARRWGVTAPASAGGGRANAIVLVQGSDLGLPATTIYQAVPCFMEYNYLDYFDVPITELAFNVAGTGSAPIAN